LNKKREALRRGLRSFIEDTSKELADLEGRPLGPFPEEAEAGVVSNAGVDAGAGRADPSREPIPLGPQAPGAQAPATGPPLVPPPLVQSAPSAVHQEQPPAAPVAAPAPSRQELDPGAAAAPDPQRRPNEGPAVPARVAKPRRRAQPPVRRHQRPAAEIGANGVNPAQVHARKGVCFAYFLNHECWRVPDAYCNSALQVCITRQCPIYHLHKDALEHRFAKKFKHLW
jgi:hypothetical protein